MVKSYLKKVFDLYHRGDATEQSYYSTLEELLLAYAGSTGREDRVVTTIPSKTIAGNPDFRVWDGAASITGYIEAKPPTTENLDRVEESEQLERYLGTFPNLILMNFVEFRLYRHGELVKDVSISRPRVARAAGGTPPLENEDDFLELLHLFFSFTLPCAFSAETLAVEPARRTKFLRDEVTLPELTAEMKGRKGRVKGFYEAFRKYLIHDLTPEGFADLYSQTITYGMFAARTRAEGEFTRRTAFDLIPHTIGILREVFRFISIEEPPEEMKWIVDDIAQVMAAADVGKILHDYYRKGKGRDPVVHFYETFLAKYDPEVREKRGVYYTPESVVSYIVRSLDGILRESFGKTDGFATDSVTVLDPAGGTLTFPAEAARLAVENYTEKYGSGAAEGLIKNHILEDFYAFELMMAPYAVGHLKMGFTLDELGYRLTGDDRFKLYLTNTLDFEEFEQATIPIVAAISEESRHAGEVKRETPILVIMGNPPYSGISTNVSEKTVVEKTRGGKTKKKKVKTWIGGLIEDYKYVDGKHFGEKKHWLQDDYVKFMRFAQWKIDRAGRGVVGMITNHGWLDNPTFRGMCQSLMKSFDEIFVLDLHGNSLKKERCPDGSEDNNVFDIRQGVAISLFVKTGDGGEGAGGCRVRHAELWGKRRGKYEWLEGRDMASIGWTELEPRTPFYFFVPREEEHWQLYEGFRKVDEIFPVNVTGIITSRDHFVIGFDRDRLKRRIMMFRNLDLPDEQIEQTFKLKDTRGWKLGEARKALAEDEDWEKHFTKILYRPFDVRHIYYSQAMVDWPRREVMRHMLWENLSLCVRRAGQVVGTDRPWNVVFISGHIGDLNLFYRGGNVNVPLYLYGPESAPRGGALSDLFDGGEEEKRPNIDPGLVEALAKAHGHAPTPEEIFHYVYAVAYSNAYREKYAEFLKTDFPRIPFTSSRRVFAKLAGRGEKLTLLRILDEKTVGEPVAKCEGVGGFRVEKPLYDEGKKRVYINGARYFEGVGPEVWDYHIGGYRVMEKWLKDRKGGELGHDDIRHNCLVATSIKKTIGVQKEVDEIYPEVEEELL